MTEHITYRSIRHLKDELALDFKSGDHIIVQEKIDGANASFQYDGESGSIAAFSHHQVLSADNTLRGFWEYSQGLDIELVRSVLGTRYRVFGEWLVSHAVVYPKECYDRFYCFDVFDTVENKYLPQEEAHRIAEQLSLPYVPTFFDGEFVSWSALTEYVGKTSLGGEKGEGIVVKNCDTGDYMKIVCREFRERIPVEKKARYSAEAVSIITRARVEKLLHKLVDEGELPENWGVAELKLINKHLPRRVFEDCMKEEPDIVKRDKQFGKAVGALSVQHVKDMLTERSGLSEIMER